MRTETDEALVALDVEWARKKMPEASSDYVLLMAMHKARYEHTGLDSAIRHVSGEWLRQEKCGRMTGEPLLPKGELPSSYTPGTTK